MIILSDADIAKGSKHLETLITQDRARRMEQHSWLIGLLPQRFQNKYLYPKPAFAPNEAQETPLHRYARYEDINSLWLLLEKSPDLRRGIDRTNGIGQTAIQSCLDENHMSSAIFLYRNGAAVDEAGEKRITQHLDFNRNFFSKNPRDTVDSMWLRQNSLKRRGITTTTSSTIAAAGGDELASPTTDDMEEIAKIIRADNTKGPASTFSRLTATRTNASLGAAAARK